MSSTLRHATIGMTLIEVLISTALIVVLITTATTAFVQMRNLARRVEARQQLHNTARIVFERLNWEFASMAQGSAFFAIGTKAGAGTPASVELVFMRGKLDNLDFMIGARYGADANRLTDQLWSRWAWDDGSKNLSLAGSSASRTFDCTYSGTAGTLGNKYFNKKFRNLPTPQRLIKAGATPLDRLINTLDATSYWTLSPTDIGDYQDLLDRSTPIAINCPAFALEVVSQDGQTHAITATGSSSTSFLCEGQPVDGRATAAAPATTPALSDRPRLLRIRFTLNDPATEVSEQFSFSFLAPALAPLSP